jgi:tetratricopeptide (TPR) repeat protein
MPGHALALENRLDEAIADYTQAIKVNPGLMDAYYDRGVARAKKADFDGALADFNKAVELNPNYAVAYYNRGHVKYFQGDLTGAMTDLNQAITLDPNKPNSHFIRGLIRTVNDDREGAASDFEQSVNSGNPDASFWLWIVRMKNGDRGTAQSELSDSLNKSQLFKPGASPKPVGDFLLGKIDQDQLLTLAKQGPVDQKQLCAAWYYIGITKRFAGDNKGAIDAFQQALATQEKTSEMYIEAQRQILNLQKP